jgi:hypothetical protein
MDGMKTHPPFAIPFGQAQSAFSACSDCYPVDASDIPFLRSHSSQLAEFTASDLQCTHITARFTELMSSRYRRASAIDAHIIGEGLHLTSVTQLSRYSHTPLTIPIIGTYDFSAKRIAHIDGYYIINLCSDSTQSCSSYVVLHRITGLGI